jgi:hypothetical protein
MAVRIDLMSLSRSMRIVVLMVLAALCGTRQDRPLSDQFREPRLEISY